MALIENTLLIKEADTVQFAVIKSWGKMKWSKTTQTLSGTADIELLDKLSSIVKLPPHIEALRQSLHDTAAAVDQERMNDSPEPLLDYPVKMKLFRHQVRSDTDRHWLSRGDEFVSHSAAGTVCVYRGVRQILLRLRLCVRCTGRCGACSVSVSL